jgi:hypothetical protein
VFWLAVRRIKLVVACPACPCRLCRSKVKTKSVHEPRCLPHSRRRTGSSSSSREGEDPRRQQYVIAPLPKLTGRRIPKSTQGTLIVGREARGIPKQRVEKTGVH